MHVIEKHASAWNAMFGSGFDEDFEINDRNMAFRGYAHQDCADCGGSAQWTDVLIAGSFVSDFCFGKSSELLKDASLHEVEIGRKIINRGSLSQGRERVRR